MGYEQSHRNRWLPGALAPRTRATSGLPAATTPATDLPHVGTGEGAAAANATSMTRPEGGIMLRRLVRIVFVLALGTTLAITVLAPPAVAQPTISATFGETATLVARGAAIDVPVTYSCSPDTAFADIGVQVTQRVGGNRLAQGFGSTSNLICDGTEHTTLIRVTASGENAFRRGVALAVGFFTACTADFVCTSIRFEDTIQIRGR